MLLGCCNQISQDAEIVVVIVRRDGDESHMVHHESTKPLEQFVNDIYQILTSEGYSNTSNVNVC